MRGVVAFFSSGRGYGFLTPQGGGTDIFCHFSGILSEGFKTLDQGDRVEFDINPSGPKGKPCAVNVRVIEGSSHGSRTDSVQS